MFNLHNVHLYSVSVAFVYTVQIVPFDTVSVWCNMNKYAKKVIFVSKHYKRRYVLCYWLQTISVDGLETMD